MVFSGARLDPPLWAITLMEGFSIQDIVITKVKRNTVDTDLKFIRKLIYYKKFDTG